MDRKVRTDSSSLTFGAPKALRRKSPKRAFHTGQHRWNNCENVAVAGDLRSESNAVPPQNRESLFPLDEELLWALDAMQVNPFAWNTAICSFETDLLLEIHLADATVVAHMNINSELWTCWLQMSIRGQCRVTALHSKRQR